MNLKHFVVCMLRANFNFNTIGSQEFIELTLLVTRSGYTPEMPPIDPAIPSTSTIPSLSFFCEDGIVAIDRNIRPSDQLYFYPTQDTEHLNTTSVNSM